MGPHKFLIFLHDRMLMGPVLCRSCACNHRSRELKNATSMLCLGDSSSQHSPSPNPLALSIFYYEMFLNLGRGNTDVPLMAEHQQSFIIGILVLMSRPLTTAKRSFSAQSWQQHSSMRYKHNYLEGNLSGTSSSFSKIVVVSMWGYMTSSATGFDQVNNTRCEFSPV